MKGLESLPATGEFDCPECGERHSWSRGGGDGDYVWLYGPARASGYLGGEVAEVLSFLLRRSVGYDWAAELARLLARLCVKAHETARNAGGWSPEATERLNALGIHRPQ